MAGGGLPPDRARRRGGIIILLLVAAVVLAALFLVPAVLDGRFGQGAQGGPDTAGNPASSEPEEQGSEGSEGSGAGAGAGEEEPSPEPTEEPEPSEKPTKEPKEEKPEEEEKEDDEEPDPEDREQATTPEGAVAGYYALLPGDTDEAWDRLTADYQNGEAQNREYYEEFWDRFDDVSVSEIDPISATEVEATVTYIYDDGSQESERRYYRFVEEDGILKIDASST